MNTIALTGRLTKDPEVRTLESGTTVCQLRLAVDGLGRNNDVGYIDVASFGNGAKAAGETLAKGWLVGVSGRLEFRTYDKDGDRRHYSRMGEGNGKARWLKGRHPDIATQRVCPTSVAPRRACRRPLGAVRDSERHPSRRQPQGSTQEVNAQGRVSPAAALVRTCRVEGGPAFAGLPR